MIVKSLFGEFRLFSSVSTALLASLMLVALMITSTPKAYAQINPGMDYWQETAVECVDGETRFSHIIYIQNLTGGDILMEEMVVTLDPEIEPIWLGNVFPTGAINPLENTVSWTSNDAMDFPTPGMTKEYSYEMRIPEGTFEPGSTFTFQANTELTEEYTSVTFPISAPIQICTAQVDEEIPPIEEEQPPTVVQVPVTPPPAPTGSVLGESTSNTGGSVLGASTLSDTGASVTSLLGVSMLGISSPIIFLLKRKLNY